jgi:glucokinase
MGVVERRPPFYLGIDLGGTNVKAGVVDDSGQPLSSVRVETNATAGPEVGLNTLAEAGRRAVAESALAWDAIAAVGLGSPGILDLGAGILIDPPNLPGWTDLPIRQLLGDRLEKPTVLQNDGNAAAYGEYWAGAGRDMRSLVLFTLGTGIGCGIVDQGRIIEGRHSHGAECGHTIIQADNPRRCPCGGYGHLEAYASAPSVVKRAMEALAETTGSVLEEQRSAGTLTCRSIAEAANAGDALARRLMRETARYLAVGAVNAMHTIDPDIVLFAGGMIAAGPEFLEEIRTQIRAMAFPIIGERVRVEYAELGGDAGFIGAAGCARQAFGARRS